MTTLPGLGRQEEGGLGEDESPEEGHFQMGHASQLVCHMGTVGNDLNKSYFLLNWPVMSWKNSLLS